MVRGGVTSVGIGSGSGRGQCAGEGTKVFVVYGICIVQGAILAITLS